MVSTLIFRVSVEVYFRCCDPADVTWHPHQASRLYNLRRGVSTVHGRYCTLTHCALAEETNETKETKDRDSHLTSYTINMAYYGLPKECGFIHTF